jgi:hypothetical protein
MRDQLPEPDPFEPSGSPSDFDISAPTTVFLKGSPNRARDGVADWILAARPGLLIVCVE